LATDLHAARAAHSGHRCLRLRLPRG